MDNAGANEVQNYVDQLGVLRNCIENKHKYWISFEYGNSGIIDKVIISYTH